MVKQEYIKIMQGKLKELGIDATQSDVDTMIKALEDTIVEIFKSGESATIGGFLKVETKHCKERQGESHLEGQEGKAWVKPAVDQIKLTAPKSFRVKHEIIK